MIIVKIHQIKDIENTDYAFRGYNPKKFDFKDYECRYEMLFATEAKTSLEICDVVFHVFNMRTPEDFRGHSLTECLLPTSLPTFARSCQRTALRLPVDSAM